MNNNLLTTLLGFFILTTTIYWIIGYSNGAKIKTFKDFFRLTDTQEDEEKKKSEEKDAIYTLIAGNITLATGMIYMISLTQTKGWFVALFAPVGALCGYFIISKIIKILPQNQESVIIFLKNESYWLYKTITIISIVVFLILIAYEINLSSLLISSLFNLSNNSEDLNGKDMQIIISAIIYISTLVYVFLGGIKGVIATDKVQLGFFVIMIIILFFGIFLHDSSLVNIQTEVPIIEYDKQIILMLITVFLTSLTTQFYNILNISVGASFKHNKQNKIFKKTGLWIVFINIVFILLGYLGLNQDNIGSIIATLSNIEFGILLVIPIEVGMLGILIATVDSTMTAISNYLYTYRNKEYNEDVTIVKKLRYIVVPNLLATIFLFGLFYYQQVDTISLLFTILLPSSILGVIMIVYIYSEHKYKKSILKNKNAKFTVIPFVIIIWFLSVYFLYMENNYYQNILSVISILFVGIIISVSDYIKYAKTNCIS